MGFVILGVAIAGALLLVIIIDILLRISLKKKLSKFISSFNALSVGMTKQQVISAFGEKCTRSVSTNSETLTWSCKTNTAIQRELYSKNEKAKTVVAEFVDNKLVSYQMI